jgi:hypothetical protein
MKKPINHFRSICVPSSGDYFCHPAEIDSEARSVLLNRYHQELEKYSPRETWVGDAHRKSAPYPVLGSKAHQRQLSELSEALVLAITDIVERWWSDAEARFPERMPIDPMEEKLLQVSHEPLVEVTLLLNNPVDATTGKGCAESIQMPPRLLETRLSA